MISWPLALHQIKFWVIKSIHFPYDSLRNKNVNKATDSVQQASVVSWFITVHLIYWQPSFRTCSSVFNCFLHFFLFASPSTCFLAGLSNILSFIVTFYRIETSSEPTRGIRMSQEKTLQLSFRAALRSVLCWITLHYTTAALNAAPVNSSFIIQ